ncbi:hypothetical protein [Candidatus Nitrospira salsa]
MMKTSVYSWRIDPDLKRGLEQAAKTEQTSVAQLLDRIVKDWLHQKDSSEDEDMQRRLHEAASQTFGAFGSGDPYGSEQVRERIRAKLRKKRATQRPD